MKNTISLCKDSAWLEILVIIFSKLFLTDFIRRKFGTSITPNLVAFSHVIRDAWSALVPWPKDYTKIKNSVRFFWKHTAAFLNLCWMVSTEQNGMATRAGTRDVEAEIRERKYLRDLLVITKSRLPLYHIQNCLFSIKFLNKKYWANHVKHSIIWKLEIYSLNANSGEISISDCLVMVSY